jgi:hypothetical protein
MRALGEYASANVARVRVRVCACVRVRVCACACARACVRVRVSYPHYNFVRALKNGVQLINLCPLSELERLSRDIRSHRDDGALLRECPACT